MKTKTLKMAIAGIAIAILSFTVFFAAGDSHAQDDNTLNSEISVDMESDDSATNSNCQVSCSDRADCSNCDVSNCEGECTESCEDKKTCKENTSCNTGCNK